ncbi:MAG: sigma-70 family RNA polymerase sigma factor [Micrococcales bacterium]|nr:sigma-70 family RNA polymerase sigma factor [Micrococcales bacterium]
MTIEGLRQGDAELLAAFRGGDTQCFESLYDRQAAAALVVARQYTDSGADAEDVVADAFTAVYSALRRGRGPTEAFRAYLFTVVRRVAALHRTQGRRVLATDDVTTLEVGVPAAGADEPALAGFESSVVAKAFASLPERWQLVLWHSEVEGATPAQIAPLLGLSANSTAALAYRAREGLRQAYLSEHLAGSLDERCRPTADNLGAYVRGGLGARASRKVAAHLDECVRCTALLAELGDVSHEMRGVIAPLVLGIAGLGALGQSLPIGGGLSALAWTGAGAASAVGAATGAGALGSWSTAGSVTGAGATSGSAAGVTAGAGGASVGLTATTSGAATLVASIPPAVTAAATAAAVVVAGAVVVVTQLFGQAPLDIQASPAEPSASVQPTSEEEPGATLDDVLAPEVSIDWSGSVLDLQAGRSGQDLRLAVQNTGDLAAADLTATVYLPDGMTFDATVDVSGVAAGGYSLPRSTSWGCVGTSSQEATCTLSRLDPETASTLNLQVTVTEAYTDDSGEIEILLSGAALDEVEVLAVPVTVRAAPERIVVQPQPPAQTPPLLLVAGRDRPLTIDVSSLDGMTAGRATALVDLPRGVRQVGRSPEGWRCVTNHRAVLACTSTAGRHGSITPLDLTLRVDPAAASGSGNLTVRAQASRSGGAITIPYTLVQPARLSLELPSRVVASASSGATDLPVTVTNTGELDSAPVSLRLSLPRGVTLDGAAHGDWSCAVSASSSSTLATSSSSTTTVQCDLGELAAGASTSATLRLTARPGASGTVSVLARAGDADTGTASSVVSAPAQTGASHGSTARPSASTVRPGTNDLGPMTSTDQRRGRR